MKIAMIGAGQQGASQGLRFIQEGYDVTFFDTNPDRKQELTERASEFGISSDKIVFSDSIQDAIQEADVVAANVPGTAFADVARDYNEYAKPGAILYDNGSGKTKTIEAIRSNIDRSDIHYVGGHFFVGKAGTGPSIATPDMYEGQTSAVFAEEGAARDTVVNLFKKLGVDTVHTHWTPEQHDEVLGRFSHANTFLVIALMLAAQKGSSEFDIENQLVFTQRFLSTTRVAANGDDGALFWGPVAIDNKDSILKAVSDVSAQLDKIKNAVNDNDVAKLNGLFKEAHEYTQTVAVDRDYEGLTADLHDLDTCLNGIKFVDAKAAYNSFSATRMLLPIIFSAASALAARDHEENGGLPFPSVNNSSFKDTLRPAREPASNISQLVINSRGDLLKAIDALKAEFDRMSLIISNADIVQINDYHDQGQEVRSQYPEAPTEARDGLVVGRAPGI